MASTIDLFNFAGVPLVTRALAENDLAVSAAGRRIGRIMRKSVSGNEAIWLWTITGPYIPPALHPSHGDCSSLDQAKVAFMAKYQTWLAWATKQGSTAAWHDGRIQFAR